MGPDSRLPVKLGQCPLFLQGMSPRLTRQRFYHRRIWKKKSHRLLQSRSKLTTPHLGPTRVILLFYGGRGRPGDVADHAERQIPTAVRSGIQLCVAVVDIVHGSHHDISRGAATFWFTQFIGGRVGDFGAAPPCETWSIARWIEYAQALLENSPQAADELHNRSHPVPLRTAAQPWGRTDLTPKEHRQVRTANVLLTYTIAFATLALFCGIGAWVEHPGLLPKHHTNGAPSIWKLESIQRLAQSPHCRKPKSCIPTSEGNP